MASRVVSRLVPVVSKARVAVASRASAGDYMPLVSACRDPPHHSYPFHSSWIPSCAEALQGTHADTCVSYILRLDHYALHPNYHVFVTNGSHAALAPFPGQLS